MSDVIQLLPDSVANQIAAGEVIQRPASVIKELVENAVDAGAMNIQVVVVDAGRTPIQVIDDGKGMSETDARLAFERHSTSKIRKADDLFNLHTMGFRGEALASIAAVAQVELKSRQASDEIGTLIRISGSRFEKQEPCSCPVGSNFAINNIFYNVPARRKFLKSNSTELNNILTAFERIALVNPQINFSLRSNETEVFNLRAANLRQRILDVFGKRFNHELLPVNVETTMCKISGFVGKPEAARKKGVHQFFFVNGRYMKHPYFNKAVMSAFDRLIPQGEQVPYFLYFEVDPKDIDVNIHPTKTEIKFENESEIWRILSAAVHASLGKFSAVPSIDFTSDPLPAAIVHDGDYIAAPQVPVEPQYNPFKPAHTSCKSGSPWSPHGQQRRTTVDRSWQRLYADFMNDVKDSDRNRGLASAGDDSVEAVFAAKETSDAAAPQCIQYALKYIVTPSPEGLLVIDQHRAHVKVLYEEYLSKAHGSAGVGQQVLFPEMLRLDPSQQLVLEGVEDELSRIGFKLSNAGGNDWRIEAVPSELMHADPRDVILRILDSVSDDSVNYGNEGTPTDTMLQRVALVTARSTAITGGKKLSPAEMQHLVSRLFALPDTRFTPNGNPIVAVIDDRYIDTLFTS